MFSSWRIDGCGFGKDAGAGCAGIGVGGVGGGDDVVGGKGSCASASGDGVGVTRVGGSKSSSSNGEVHGGG